jgi:NADPH-dependent 2,4-dienoyl-CoA reductase/sulfur reductase-like enzyme/peroxiredoxin family protein/TusA-related sulfurtransferase/rhodanese-related sulfurtransferase
MKYVIIGGVAGGATAAARIRRQDEMGEIVLVEKGQHISYANCGLPYYIGGVIKDRQRLFVQTPESFSRRFNIDVRVQNEALAIHPEQRTVTIKAADGKTYTENYDRLLLAPGALPLRPRLEGIDNEGIFTLRDVADTDRIKAFIDAHPHGKAVIVGGGFIGLEMAENLVNAGISVDIVEMADQVMGPLDFSMASMVHSELSCHGVGLHLGKAVKKFEKRNGRLWVSFAGGEGVEADMVLLSIGVRPSTQLATNSGLELGARGIKVNDYLQTSDPNIYAVGDAIEFNHPLTGQPWLNYLAGPANRQARIAADNMVQGNHETYEGSIGTAIAKVFNLDVASTGLPAKRLKQMGISYTSSTTTSAAHAGYYPGAFNMTIKLTFDPKTGKLFGGQCIGRGGVDKRIDEIALTIKRGGTVYDLISMEQAYAPPFSSAKDPLTIAGYVAGNILSGAMPVIYWREIRDLDRQKVTLLDVRTPEEFALGTIEGAKNIPLDDLRERLGEIPADRPVVVFCAVGLRGYLAQRILLGRGFKDVRNLSGGYKLYRSATQPVNSCPSDDNAAYETGSKPVEEAPATRQLKLDACGLSCPGPIIELKKAIDGMASGETIEVTATDPGFPRDAKAWCSSTGNSVVTMSEDGGYHKVVVRKGEPQEAPTPCLPTAQGKTLIMFSDDLDRAIATFVLANGAAATGKKVSIFFTFWGLNVLKKEVKPKVKKDFFGRMFGWMLPSSSRHLHLSQMSFFGLGDKLMRHIMRSKGIDQLEDLRQKAQEAGVEFIACQMTMDMMGIAKEELIDGVTVGGVATYMQRAEQANVNLFI